MVAAFLITSGLRFIKNTTLTPGATGTSAITQTTTEEITLNEFLALYGTGAFEKVVLKDAIKLEGYDPQEDVEPQANFFGVKPDAVYTIYTTNKPLESSLADLGISAT